MFEKEREKKKKKKGLKNLFKKKKGEKKEKSYCHVVNDQPKPPIIYQVTVHYHLVAKPGIDRTVYNETYKNKKRHCIDEIHL